MSVPRYIAIFRGITLMRVGRKTTVFAVCGFALAVAVGCGDSGGPKPPMGRVTGKVVYKGQPVTKGIVTFVPIPGKGGETGQSASGNIESDGTFKLTTFNTNDGAIVGQHTATVREDLTPTPPAPGEAKKDAFPGKMPDFSGKVASNVPKPTLSAKYASVESSPLKYTVESSGNDFTIELED